MIFIYLFFPPGQKNKKTQKFRPSSKTTSYSSFYLACMVFPLQFACPIAPCHHLPWWLHWRHAIPVKKKKKKKDNKKNTRPVTKRNESPLPRHEPSSLRSSGGYLSAGLQPDFFFSHRIRARGWAGFWALFGSSVTVRMLITRLSWSRNHVNLISH